MTSQKIKYSISILNSFVVLSELFFLVYAAVKWQTLTKDEGWGMLALILLALLVLTGLVVDLILQMLIKDKLIMNLIGAVFCFIYLYVCFATS